VRANDGDDMTDAVPTAEFFSIYDGAPLPTPASVDLMGALPIRAAQFCVPIKAASGLGFYLYPPVDFAVRWDGQRTDVTWLDARGQATEWLPLDGGVDVHLPGSGAVRAAVPADRAVDLDSVMDPEGTPFINADPRAAHQMEITTGLVARTQPGWGILVRGLANWGPHRDHQVLDGFVETDWYRSFLPVIVRATTPGAEVRFFRRMPMAQLVVLPLAALRPEAGGETGTSSAGIAGWPDDLWREFVTTRAPRHLHETRGTYASASRRAEKTDRCPYSDAPASA
jgi:Family of unknown function (DUF6065)